MAGTQNNSSDIDVSVELCKNKAFINTYKVNTIFHEYFQIFQKRETLSAINKLLNENGIQNKYKSQPRVPLVIIEKGEHNNFEVE